MPERSYWFTKWLIAFGLFLPFWGFMSLDGYRNDQSFLWNAANYPITVSFLPRENVLNCWSFELGDAINASFGFSRENQPPGCVVRAKWSYITVLGVSFFMLISGIYFLLRPPQVDEYKIVDDAPQKEKPRRVRRQTLDEELIMAEAETPAPPPRRRSAVIPNEALPPDGYEDSNKSGE